MCPDTAILNLYQSDSTMGLHQDDVEKEAFDQPVVSLSFGCSAVFLIGAADKAAVAPLPIMLRSGDCLVMGGEARLAYHAVPRIFEHTAPEILREEMHQVIGQRDEHAGMWEYLEHSRINLNVRQIWARN
jgi:alkylated DNA repair protein alkB family protein 1